MNGELKRKIDGLRDLLVGVVPVPTDQVKQITLGLIYKFMGDMDEKNRELGGGTFFAGDYQKYAWKHLMASELSAYERTALYSEGLERMSQNANIPQLFRDIFKGAFLLFKNPDIVNQFLKGLNEFTYSHSEDLGDAYEYLLSIMGAQGKAGQFRTPRHIIDFIVECAQPHKDERILDPACGTAGFLVSAYKHILRKNTVKDSGREGSALTAEERKQLTHNFTGYDISPDMVRISLVNLYLHQFSGPRIYEYDTLTSLERWDEVFDCILTNPPFMSPKGGIQPHNRFGVKSSRSEVLFVDYILEHLSPQGRAGVIVPEGIIFQSGNAYRQLRRKLVEEGYLYAVVSLPAGVFQPYSGVKTSILLIDRRLAQQAKDILFLKVEADGYDLGAQRKPTDKDDLPKTLDFISSFTSNLTLEKIEDKKNIAIIKKENILDNPDINLSIERYVTETKKTGKEKYPLVRLDEIISLEYGSSLPAEKRISGEYPVYGSNGIVGFHNQFKVNGPFIIVGRKGSAGKVHLSEKDGFPIDTTFFVKIIDQKRIDLYFLFHMLKSLELEKVNVQSGVPGLNRNDAYQIKIPLPPLEVQRQIVAEIEAWQKVIDGARQVVANWKPEIKVEAGWPIFKFEELCQINSGSINPQNDFKTGSFIYIDISSVENGTGIVSFNNVIPVENAPDRAKRLVKNGDVLLSTVRPNLKAFAYLEKLPERTVASTGFAVLRPKDNRLLSKFLFYMLFNETVMTQMINNMGKGSYPSINQNDVSNLKIGLPPTEIQQKIVNQLEEQQKGVEACRRLIESHEARIRAKIGEVWGEDKNG